MELFWAPGPLVWGPPGPSKTQRLRVSLELDFPPINHVVIQILNETFKKMWILALAAVLEAPWPLVWGPPGPPKTQRLGVSLELDFPPIN